MKATERKWPQYILVLLIGVVLGIVVSYQTGWFSPHDGTTPVKKRVSFTAEAKSSASADVKSLTASLSGVAQRVMPAVVNISSMRVYRTPGQRPPSSFFRDPFFRDFFGEDFFRFFGIPRERVERSLGSGVIVTRNGYIATNNHVVSQATQVKVSLADKREFNAEIVGTDPKTDVALLKIDGKGLPTIRLGDSDKALVGDIVLAIGNPFGIGQTVTMGIISAKGRSNVGIVDYEDFIQSDAAINPGNSGGALVNIEGDLVGINTAIVSRTGGYQGIGFAIPSNMAKAVMKGLLEHGKVIRGWLGASVQEVTPQIAAEFRLQSSTGALIVEVYPRSPAARAGLRRGDIILQYGDEQVERAVELRNLVTAMPAGTEAKLNAWRNGEVRELTVVIEELPG